MTGTAFLQQRRGGRVPQYSQDFISSLTSAKSFKTKGGSWQDFKRSFVDEVTQAALLYLAKLLETNKDKTYSLWVSQEPLRKTTDAELPGHCNVTSYSKMTKQYLVL